METAKNVTSIILCGGKERRFGSSKALAVVGGTSVIDRLLGRLAPLSSQVLVVTSPGKPVIPLEGRARIVYDEYPGKGPLGGIYSGLRAAENECAIVVACDMPFVNPDLLQEMVGMMDAYDAVIPRLGKDMLEPLHAVYRRSCAAKMKVWLETGRLSIHRFVEELHVRYLEKSECLQADPRMLSFFNINYQEDLERANRIAEADGGPS